MGIRYHLCLSRRLRSDTSISYNLSSDTSEIDVEASHCFASRLAIHSVMSLKTSFEWWEESSHMTSYEQANLKILRGIERLLYKDSSTHLAISTFFCSFLSKWELNGNESQKWILTWNARKGRNLKGILKEIKENTQHTIHLIGLFCVSFSSSNRLTLCIPRVQEL